MVATVAAEPQPDSSGADRALVSGLREQIALLEARVQASEERRRAMLHIMKDLTESNRRLNDQRRAMLHILVDYESDRKNLAQQTERLNNSRRALMHILSDAHSSNVRLGLSRKAMIHIMGDLRQTTEEMRLRESELREKQEQLVQAAKLATLGELTTGVAHELNNPLNNIGLFVGNVLELMAREDTDEASIQRALTSTMQQVQKATEIINHLRTFGRAAPTSRDVVSLNAVAHNAALLLHEQLRLRDIELTFDLSPENPNVVANAIQLEQVVMNLLTNARDAVNSSAEKRIGISSWTDGLDVVLAVEDSGHGIAKELEQRIFDPFFTTKDVGEGTGLGLSIVYGIIRDHEGSISVEAGAMGGARFSVRLPLEASMSAV
jgi:C4-dicarboxylate-specific signal transduction histidine kinase